MEAQEMFDKCVKHLADQGGPALGLSDVSGRVEACKYRTTDGRKCAAGFFLPDENYTPDMENKTIATCYDKFPTEVQPFIGKDENKLLNGLQDAHDMAHHNDNAWDRIWSHENGVASLLVSVAAQFKLSHASVEAAFPK